VQQLAVEPVPAFVGQTVSIRATSADGAQEGLTVMVETPDGSRRELGTTDARGAVAFTIEMVGPHVFSAQVGGARCVASVAFRPARRAWMLAAVCVPLGLALLLVYARRLLLRRQREPA